MRVGNLAGRLVLIVGNAAIDVEKASDGAFGADPQSVYDHWDEFVTWSRQVNLKVGDPFDEVDLDSPAPALARFWPLVWNYTAHAAESGYAVPDGAPPVFTKFPSCITGPRGEIALPPKGHTDWEVELVAVIGRHAYQVAADEALSYIAGYAVGQDISERTLQMAATPPQFSLGKSMPGFGPIGPWLVTLDEFDDPNDLELGCAIDGEQVQLGRTRDLLFSVPTLVAKLSAIMPLLPGDVIFTEHPLELELGEPRRGGCNPGEELVSHIEGIGELRHKFVAAKEV